MSDQVVATRTNARSWRLPLRLPQVGLGTGLALVAAAVVLPIIILFVLSLQTETSLGEGPLTFSNYTRMFESGRALEGLRNTLAFTVGGGAFALFLGAGMAWAVTSVNVPFRRVLRILPMLVLILPPLLKNMAFIMMFGESTGLVNIAARNVLGIDGSIVNIYSIWGMMFVMGIYQAPVAYSIMLLPFQAIDKSQLEASKMAGARLPRTLRRVVLPKVLPAMLSAFMLMVISIAASFETPVMIGLPAGIHTYMSEIYRSMTSQTAGLNLAAAQGMLYLLLTLSLVGLYMAATRNERRFEAVGGKGNSQLVIDGPVLRWAMAGFVGLYCLFSFVIPMAITILSSIIPFYTVVNGNPFHSFTLENFRRVFTTPEVVESIQQSFLLAIIVVIGTIVVAGVLAVISLKTKSRFRRSAEFLSMAPKAMPGPVYSVALLLTVLAVPGLAQIGYGTKTLMYIAVIVMSMPFAYRLISSSVIQVSDELLEASRMSGAGTVRGVRDVLVPIVRPALFYTAALIFAMSYRELGAVVFLVPPDTQVVSALTFTFWINGGLTMVAALNLVLVLVPAVMIVLFFSLSSVKLPLGRGRRRRRPNSLSGLGPLPESAPSPEVSNHGR